MPLESCPYCGADVAPNALRCPRCGGHPKARRNATVVAVVGAALVLALALLLFA